MYYNAYKLNINTKFDMLCVWSDSAFVCVWELGVCVCGGVCGKCVCVEGLYVDKIKYSIQCFSLNFRH